MIAYFIYYWNYAPIWQPLLFSAIPILIWCVFLLKADITRVRIASAALFLISTAVILYITVLSRTKGTIREVELIPFSFVHRGLSTPTAFRGFWMNIYLFIPVGLSSLAVKRRWHGLLFGVILSIFVEIMQFRFHLGTCEADDIIANTLGCAIGVWICGLIVTARKK